MKFLPVVLTTGLCSLAYQVVWQRYLSVLIGTEARSSTLIVAVFLLGLSIGYYLFGRIAARARSRMKLLRYYGYVELATGAFAIMFPSIFSLFFHGNFSQTDSFFLQFLMVLSLLILPTILMGATIPVMTSVLPTDGTGVNRLHVLIYGVNTMGAFAGTIIAGLYLIPLLGFENASILFGLLNAIVSLFYIFNRLQGDIVLLPGSEDASRSRFHPYSLYLLSFLVGSLTLGIEILWFRVAALTIGSSYIVFPLILSIFVLAIGSGSITLKQKDDQALIHNLSFGVFFSLLTFLVIPYLPLFISTIRVLMVTHPMNFVPFHLIVAVVFALVLFPGVFFLGRLLPLIFTIFPHRHTRVGSDCGTLYFLNTLGTFTGSVFFGYLLLHLFSLETIYRVLLVSLIGAAVYFIRPRRYPVRLIAGVILAGVALLLPFPRHYHALALYRNQTIKPDHLEPLIRQTHRGYSSLETLFFKDDPGTTVAVMQTIETSGDTPKEKLITVNGKSDSSTIGDYPTTSLLALIPYAMTSKPNLRASVVGIGTGVTAGLLSRFERIAHLDVIEISSAVIEAASVLEEENAGFIRSPRVEIHNQDAFLFFRKTDHQFDIVVSEPTNPWVMGVENLYTPYFYEITAEKMAPDGVMLQWIHLYSMSLDILTTVLHNLHTVFKEVHVFSIGVGGDIALVARKHRSERSPLQPASPEPVEREILSSLGLTSKESLLAFLEFSPGDVDAILATNSHFQHDIFYPTISRKAYFQFFLDTQIQITDLLSPWLLRWSHSSSTMYKEQLFNDEMVQRCTALSPNKQDMVCKMIFAPYHTRLAAYRQARRCDITVSAYAFLRSERVVPGNSDLLRNCATELITAAETSPDRTGVLQQLDRLSTEFIRDGLYADALKLKQDALRIGLIDNKDYEKVQRQIAETSAISRRLFEKSGQFLPGNAKP